MSCTAENYIISTNMPQIFISKEPKKKKVIIPKSSGVIFTGGSKPAPKMPESHSGQNKDMDIKKTGTAESLNPSFYSGLERDF